MTRMYDVHTGQVAGYNDDSLPRISPATTTSPPSSSPSLSLPTMPATGVVDAFKSTSFRSHPVSQANPNP